MINLLGRETGPQADLLRDELAQLIKQQPYILQQVINQEFNATMPAALISALQEISWKELTAEVRTFCNKINPDLEEALTIVTRFANPTIRRHEIIQALDILARALRPQLSQCTTAFDLWKCMGRFFFFHQGFLVFPSARHLKDISFGHFLQKRQGAALCLCCLYVVCAERFGLDGSVVDVAGRLLACIRPQDGSEPIFADPLSHGQLITLTQCKQYIAQRQLEWNDNFIQPLSSLALLRRFLAKMIFIANRLHDERRLSYLRRYMDLLKD